MFRRVWPRQGCSTARENATFDRRLPPGRLDPLASLAAGCTLAPSSIGIALNVLRAADALNTPVGQLIIASAVLDDVIALLLLTLLQALGSDASPASMVAPAVASVGLMAAAVVIAKHGTPRLVRLAERVAPAQLRSGGRAAEERALLLLLLLVTAVFVPLARAFAPLESWRAFETYAATCHVPLGAFARVQSFARRFSGRSFLLHHPAAARRVDQAGQAATVVARQALLRCHVRIHRPGPLLCFRHRLWPCRTF